MLEKSNKSARRGVWAITAAAAEEPPKALAAPAGNDDDDMEAD